MEEEIKEQLNSVLSDDETLVSSAHNKLLGAVSQLYDKKRVKAPTRKEPSLEVSEFHLSHPDKKRGRVKVSELANVLNKRAAHAEISQKLKTAHKRAKTLPKPLEKIHADKISRAAGYEHAKHQLNRWDAIVYKQKVAEQLSFPLKNDTIKVHHDTNDVSKIFRKPSELEVALAELLKQPDPTAPEKKEPEKNNEGREEEYPLSLAEVIEKRKMMAKLRAQQSYKQAKAVRHSKIKSKKFHQIQRRARVKEQMKEFEELQKKDPEAALKKLEELERTRAEERVTLRHRSTGQWAKNLSVRAKYDKEARIALAEQLSKSKELTVKLAQHQDSESEKEDEEEMAQPEATAENTDNPWVINRSKEMDDFLSGYRKYWDSHDKDTEKSSPVDTAVKVSSSSTSQETSETANIGSSDKESKELQQSDSVQHFTNSDAPDVKNCINGDRSLIENTSIPTKNCFSASYVENNHSEDENHVETSAEKTDTKCDKLNMSLSSTLSKNFIVDEQSPSKLSRKTESKSNNSFIINSNQNCDRGLVNKRKSSSCINQFIVNESPDSNSKTSEKPSTLFAVNISPIVTKQKKISNKNHNLKKQDSGNSTKLNCSIGSWTVTKVKQQNKSTISNSKVAKLERNQVKTHIKTASKAPEIATTEKISLETEKNNNITQTNQTNEGDDKHLVRKEKSLDELFEEVEDKLQSKMREKYEKLKDRLNRKRQNEVENHQDSESEEVPSLELKKRKVTADVDEELLEEASETNRTDETNSVLRTVTTASAEVKATDDIDPNKFLKVTPRQLSSKLPDIMTEGEDALDDEETTAQERHLTIAEAFAEDDVVDQFQKEKDEEVKKNSVGDVDLTLPGWGSWAGHNMRPMSRRKRKKFVIKFPKIIPRRDTNRGNVIINEDADKPIKDHQVSEVPFPFTSVKEYEASIRAPLGATWVPQTAHVKLTAPPVITKMGSVITPMDDSQLVKKDNTLKKKVPKKNKKILNKK